MQLSEQIAWLFLLALPIACIAWAVTHERICKEPRDFCVRKSNTSKTFLGGKFFYHFTCEYCFSYYVTLVFLIFTKYHLLLAGWGGCIVAFFALVWIANIYMSLFCFIRVAMKKEKKEADIEDSKLKAMRR
ncbi:MAG: hypothetical protein WKF91_12110 [Segetibacter sp.]